MYCLYQVFSLERKPFLNLHPLKCVHSECTLPDKVILILSDPLLCRSTESSKPQSPSKRLSVSRGIKQLFQSATKFVRLLQR